MNNLVRLISVLTTILIISHVQAENDPSPVSCSIKGRIVTTGQKPLMGAHIHITGTREGCISDSAGNFEIRVIPGLYPLRVSFVGYQPLDTTIAVTGTIMISVNLPPSELSLDEVTITAASDQDIPPGYLVLDRKTLDKIPVLMGERDLMKACQYFPGIHSVVEGNTGISVRGGNLDENLIL
ncbi:MAG: carboxypeptidase-like regulatory domain-containing protein, partial [Bacteroidales bacterium]|nr:carboxypeptidase-like regulatory domain-containing protein [Bacteroidales bacterium]